MPNLFQEKFAESIESGKKIIPEQKIHLFFPQSKLIDSLHTLLSPERIQKIEKFQHKASIFNKGKISGLCMGLSILFAYYNAEHKLHIFTKLVQIITTKTLPLNHELFNDFPDDFEGVEKHLERDQIYQNKFILDNCFDYTKLTKLLLKACELQESSQSSVESIIKKNMEQIWKNQKKTDDLDFCPLSVSLKIIRDLNQDLQDRQLLKSEQKIKISIDFFEEIEHIIFSQINEYFLSQLFYLQYFQEDPQNNNFNEPKNLFKNFFPMLTHDDLSSSESTVLRAQNSYDQTSFSMAIPLNYKLKYKNDSYEKFILTKFLSKLTRDFKHPLSLGITSPEHYTMLSIPSPDKLIYWDPNYDILVSLRLCDNNEFNSHILESFIDNILLKSTLFDTEEDVDFCADINSFKTTRIVGYAHHPNEASALRKTFKSFKKAHYRTFFQTFSATELESYIFKSIFLREFDFLNYLKKQMSLKVIKNILLRDDEKFYEAFIKTFHFENNENFNFLLEIIFHSEYLQESFLENTGLLFSSEVGINENGKKNH